MRLAVILIATGTPNFRENRVETDNGRLRDGHSCSPSNRRNYRVDRRQVNRRIGNLCGLPDRDNRHFRERLPFFLNLREWRNRYYRHGH